MTRATAHDRVLELLDVVGLAQPQRTARAFPHELSGGMCQRVMIAIAVANDPDVLIADEPTTGLDVTVQAQVLDLLRSVSVEKGMAMVLISHDLGVVAGCADEVAVMYAGVIVERGPVEDLFAGSHHPYTRPSSPPALASTSWPAPGRRASPGRHRRRSGSPRDARSTPVVASPSPTAARRPSPCGRWAGWSRPVCGPRRWPRLRRLCNSPCRTPPHRFRLTNPRVGARSRCWSFATCSRSIPYRARACAEWRAGSRPSTASPSTLPGARRSPWWASPVAGSRPSPDACSAWWSRLPARCGSEARTC